ILIAKYLVALYIERLFAAHIVGLKCQIWNQIPSRQKRLSQQIAMDIALLAMSDTCAVSVGTQCFFGGSKSDQNHVNQQSFLKKY
ncbi:hypothetical protein, partial [Streptomyces galilaeus]|uniref:hypothetical protein n=1 Tax=Streptomyces galilaeus TaxID=33899 RepID=UPI0038F80F60